MLDVHAPEHGIHGVRDFFIHLLTITVGLLIALGLENAAEAMHHRHQRKEAEAMIREELRDNRKTLNDGTPALKREIDGMTKALDGLEALSAGKPLPKESLDEKELQFRQGQMQDSAWRTASTTGALSYMDYGEVETFSAAYKEQDELEAMGVLAVNDYLQLMPILSHHQGDMTPQLANEAIPYARSAIGHLSGMYFIGVGTAGAYEGALK